jgi:hypothetical protein
MVSSLNGYTIKLADSDEQEEWKGSDVTLLNKKTDGLCEIKRWGYGGIGTFTLTLIEDTNLVRWTESIIHEATRLLGLGKPALLILDFGDDYTAQPGLTVYVLKTKLQYSEAAQARTITLTLQKAT